MIASTPPWRSLTAVFAALPVAACVVGPNYHRPVLTSADGYGALAVAPGDSTAGAARLTSGADIPAAWWEVFHNAQLDELVAQALKNNPTVSAAQSALRAAREQVSAQRGAFFPSVSASISPSRQDIAPTLASPLQTNTYLYNLTTTQVSVSYAPDIFGANRRAVESLAAQADQQRFQLEATRLTLASNVVQAAIEDALLRAEIDTTKSIIAGQTETLASFRRQFALGQASGADLAAQEALLAQAQASLPPLEKQFRINRDLLAALVGRTPGQPVTVDFDFVSLSLPHDLPLSLPADLVEHRPDVRMAEADLHAASAQVGVAVAARLPDLQITGSAGSAALGLTPEFNSASNFWSIAATLTQPIFEGGTLLHRQRAAEAAYGQAAQQYRATVVGAFQNTADTLHALWTDADAETAARTQAQAAGRSLEIAKRQFAMGDLSRLEVIVAEQTDDQAELSLLQARASRYNDVVALFQALGGGWWNRDVGAGKSAGHPREER